MKFRIAKLFVKELHRIYGDNLKAVFVAGSVADNMALPESDIDIMIVRSIPDIDRSNARSINQIVSDLKIIKLKDEFKTKYKKTIDTALIESSFFETLNKKPMIPIRLEPVRDALIYALSHGVIPIFGDKEYLARTFKEKSWSFPNIKAIKREHARKQLGSFWARVVANQKKGQRRFMP